MRLRERRARQALLRILDWGTSPTGLYFVTELVDGEDLKLATANRDPSRALVLLAHQPRQVRRASKYGVDLQLSGHTHGGQIWPWHYIVSVQQGGLLAGRYQHGNTQLYVTRGCGYWGPPVRLGAPLEITRVILRSA